MLMLVLLLRPSSGAVGLIIPQLQHLAEPGRVGCVCYEGDAARVLQAVGKLPTQQCHRLHVPSCTQGTRCNEDFFWHFKDQIFEGTLGESFC